MVHRDVADVSRRVIRDHMDRQAGTTPQRCAAVSAGPMLTLSQGDQDADAHPPWGTSGAVQGVTAAEGRP
jgi:hypothetical protein